MTARTPEIKTWLFLKAFHTPFLRGTQPTTTDLLPISVHAAIWEQSESVYSKSGTLYQCSLRSLWLRQKHQN